VALLGVGAGAWAALSFFQQGAQPAEALPASTVGYLSLDLDPAGGQKIDAFRTLNKFPAFKDEVGVNSVDELRRKVGEALVSDSGCPGLDYGRDIDPWLGDRMAAAVVPLANRPHLVVVLQVKDDGAARDGLTKIDACSDSGDDGVVVKNGWAVLAESQEIADEVSTATEQGTLADDASYQKWTKAVGEAGVLNGYASPEAGHYAADALGDLFGGTLTTESPGPLVIPSSDASMSASNSSFHTTAAGDGDNPLSDFKGAALTLRFTGDGLELAVAADGSSSQLSQLSGTTGGTLVQRMPDDTAVAAGITLRPGWLDRQLKNSSGFDGFGVGGGGMLDELSSQTGLKLPDDLETLLGSGVAVSVGKDFDFEAAENTDDGTGLPVAVLVKGDPPAIEKVLDKVRAKAPALAFLGSDSSGDLVAIGPTPAYRKHVLDGGNLGDGDAFRSVVPDAGDASSLLYVDIDSLEPSFTKALGSDRETLGNLTPLRSVGMSTWNDGGMIRFSLKASTN
jgi:hypothetical protein